MGYRYRQGDCSTILRSSCEGPNEQILVYDRELDHWVSVDNLPGRTVPAARLVAPAYVTDNPWFRPPKRLVSDRQGF
jgi:hypothetical protein